jgi:CheY-like chemotaxis protein
MEGWDEGGKRLLVVDDEPAMHACYRRSFAAVGDGAALGAMAADLFGAGPSVCDEPAFTLTHCHQGLDAVAEVERVLAAGAPYSVAFIDVRLPPGIDGRETARRIRALDPAINLVRYRRRRRANWPPSASLAAACAARSAEPFA